MAKADKALVMHVALAFLCGQALTGTDAPESMGFTVEPGNKLHIKLEPDSRADAQRLFSALAAGGQVEMPMQDMFWGAYFGKLTDRFGVRWMVKCAGKA